MLKGRIEEIFDLNRIQSFVEQNIHDTEWIEVMPGEKRRILVIETLVDGEWCLHSRHGSELLGERRIRLEDPYSEKEWIHDVNVFRNEVNSA